jgi:hypothetical protein
MEIKINTKTEYFAIKESIFAAIRYFQKKKSNNEVLCKCTYDDGTIDIEIYRSVIVNYLGYDFIAKKKQFKEETKPNGKLYNKIQILNLYTEILEAQFLINCI